jgi:hypothetical protein
MPGKFAVVVPDAGCSGFRNIWLSCSDILVVWSSDQVAGERTCQHK